MNKKKIIILGVVLVVIAGAIFLYLKPFKRRNKSYSEIKPTTGTISTDIRLTGYVKPRNRLEIKPSVAGRIDIISVVEGQKIKKGEIVAWMSSTDRAALIDAVRTKGADEIKKWEDVYKPTPIISPIDGFVIVRAREPGQTIAQNEPILVMADKLIIEANVDETDLKHIKLGQTVRIFLDAYPDERFAGHVEHVAYESEIISNVIIYRVKILPMKTPGNFRSGMTASMSITINKKQDILILPVSAITEKNNKKFILVKSKSKKPEMREIKTGISDGKNVEVLSGVTENDTLLTSAKSYAANKRNSQSASGSGLRIPRSALGGTSRR